jgi:hypothetical protein
MNNYELFLNATIYRDKHLRRPYKSTFRDGCLERLPLLIAMFKGDRLRTSVFLNDFQRQTFS